MLARRGVGGPTGDQRDGHRQMGGVANSGVARRGRRGVSGMCRQNEGRGGPRAWTGVMELPAVMGGFLNVTTTEGNEFMRKQIQEVLRKAGDESSDRGSAEEREDLRGVEVNSVQQLYVNVKGMRTSAATNKCEFGYTTPSGEELRWGPT
eukprot:6191821-Pleurochrysis_carterae.AAC.1